jgi:hypothetical protein
MESPNMNTNSFPSSQDPGSLVSGITFVLLLCNTDKKPVPFEEIAAQAVRTYPDDFSTLLDGRKTPRIQRILSALDDGKCEEWGYVSGNWRFGWRLTNKGTLFAKRVEKLAQTQIYGTDNLRLAYAA